MKLFGFPQLVISAFTIRSFLQPMGGVYAYATPLKERDMIYDWNSVSIRPSPNRNFD
jgi:hypothetical protein